MISFRSRQEIGTSVATILACVALAAILGFLLWARSHPIKPQMSRDQLSSQVTAIKVEEKKARLANEDHVGNIGKWLWQGTPEEIGSTILDRATKLSQSHHLTLVAVRPQKQADAGGLTQFPFQISVSGSFPQVAGLIRDLETPSERLCVNLVQISAGEGEGNSVSATIGTSIFVQPKPATPASNDKSGKSSNAPKTQ